MEPMVISLGGRGRASRVCRPVIRLAPSVRPVIEPSRLGRDPRRSAVSRSGARSGRIERAAPASRLAVSPAVAAGRLPRWRTEPDATLAVRRRRQARSLRPGRQPSKGTGSDASRRRQIERFKVRDEFDNCVVARLHGRYGDKTALILPDGQLGFRNRLVPTDEPFQPLTADQLETLLQDGPFAEYNLLEDGTLPDLLQVVAGVRAGQRPFAR